MIQFIWLNWWRNKQRFILLLVGILIISSGLTFLSTLNESNFGTVSETLEKNWKASYDIVVRSPDARSVTEEDNLFEPNFLSGIGGGISVEQYKKIKQIADVDIAAPLAVMGYAVDTMVANKIDIQDNGVYRLTKTITSNSGIYEEVSTEKSYFTIGFVPDVPLANRKYEPYGTSFFGGEVPFFEERLLVGIDQEQEARLIGLDEAILSLENSRYFEKKDVPQEDPGAPLVNTGRTTTPVKTLPILISSQPFVDQTRSYRIEKLDLPFETQEQIKQTMETVKENGGEDYLHQVRALGDGVFERIYHTEDVYEIHLGHFTGIDPKSGDPYVNENTGISPFHQLLLAPSSLFMEKMASPYSDQWQLAYSAKPLSTDYRNPVSSQIYKNSFRPYSEFNTDKISDTFYGHLLKYEVIGIYDPGKLKLAKDPVSETPLETYRMATARLVLDADGKPVNPPKDVRATTNPLGVLTSPPTLLTTIDGATAVLGDQAISAIRVKVAGVSDLSAESQAKVERVAAEIERETGLIADIIMGSSPEPVLINVPLNGDVPALGWIEQMWIKVGVATGIFQETQMGFSLIMLLILFVAVLYVQATQLVSLFMRRKEFAVLLAVGWKPLQLKRMILQEAALLGLFAMIVSGAIGFGMQASGATNLEFSRIGLFALLGLVIYLLGSLWPAWLSGRIKPYETMRTGEITKQSRRWVRTDGMLSMVLNHFLGKLGRYSLSVVSIALPTALLVLLLFITLRLKGVLYTSWVGQYISVQIGPQHYVAIAATLAICILTTGELVWQNVTERKVELFLLKSIGWRNGAVRRLILLEGWVCGLLSGLIGYGIGLLLVWYMYASVPWLDALYLLPVCTVPMMIGLLSAWIPAEIAVRGFPAGTTQTIYASSKRTERMFFVTATVVGLIVLGIGGKLAYDYVPGWLAANTAKPQAVQTNLIEEKPEGIGELKGFKPQGVLNGSKAIYDLTLEMDETGKFDLKAVIDVTNESEEAWDQLVFYMIPNQFVGENKDPMLEGPDGTLQIHELSVDGQLSKYELFQDNLTVPLAEPLKPDDVLQLQVTYSFTLPEPGHRYSKDGDNYYLAQFYPMLANYNEGWNKQGYFPIGESYLTDFTDFTIRYKVPDGYLVASSADDEPDITPTVGEFEAKRVKEVFIAIMKDRIMRKQKVGSTEIRVFGKREDEFRIDGWLDDAVKTFRYFEETIGIYPRRQLDILIVPGASMEYPGIVTLGNFADTEQVKQTLQHEIAHQWFYGVVSNDPYIEGFLDEGFAEFSASLFRMDAEQMGEANSFMKTKEWESSFRGTRKSSNLPLPEYEIGSRIYTYIYAQPTLKLWELFSNYEGIETARAYLKAYYHAYAYKQVDTKEFIRFTKAYFLMEDDKFFESWLK